jgi:sulfotransferase
VGRTYHFITGLPRAGSTLLAAILRQNPRVHAGMSSPVAGIVRACLSAMGADNEFAAFISEAQKRAILHGVFEGYYGALEPKEVVFDTNRAWTSRIAALRRLFPGAKFVCCVRNPAWILDSVERLLRRNAFDQSKLFSAAERDSVYARAEALARRDRLIGFAWSALREAYHGEDSGEMLLVDYDLLAARPKETVDLIYDFIGEPRFAHDFENVAYEADDFDMGLIAKGLHTVQGRVELKLRATILPPDLFEQFQKMTFWTDFRGTNAKVIVERPEPPRAVATTERRAS